MKIALANHAQKQYAFAVLLHWYDTSFPYNACNRCINTTY